MATDKCRKFNLTVKAYAAVFIRHPKISRENAWKKLNKKQTCEKEDNGKPLPSDDSCSRAPNGRYDEGELADWLEDVEAEEVEEEEVKGGETE
jgi:hypothetical protein